MSSEPEGIRVKIVGYHPWHGYTGLLIEVNNPLPGVLPKMGKVILDRGQDCPAGHECFAESKNLKAIGKDRLCQS